MIAAKIGAFLLAPFLAFSSYFGFHHSTSTNMHPMPNWHATTTASTTNNMPGWVEKKDKDDHAHTGTTTKSTVKVVSITSIQPSTAKVGSLITLTGTGFTSDARVHFGIGAVSTSTISSGGKSISFNVPSYIGPWCEGKVMCEMLVRLVTPATYNVWVEDKIGHSNIVKLEITDATTSTAKLSVTGIDAPVSLTMGTNGTWTVHVNASQTAGQLHYSVTWGDEDLVAALAIRAPDADVTTATSATFTHVYSKTGTYAPTFVVSDDNGHTATMSATVEVTPIY